MSDICAAVVAATRDTVTGDGLAGLQAAVRLADPSGVALATAFVDALADKTPAADALIAVAAAADRSGVENAFHNPAHSREVAIDWWLLARMQGVVGPLGLIAAFGHDLGHDGVSPADAPPYRLEALAATATTDIMRDAGVGEQDRAAVAAMILATDVSEGYAQLAGHGAIDPRFAPFENAATLAAARLLRDADLMPSAGTSIEAYHARTAELECELRLPLGGLSGAAAAAFFDRVVERHWLSPAAQIFAPTLAKIALAATGR